MALFQGIRDFFAERQLAQIRKQSRQRKVINYQEAKGIGVIYNSDSESTFILIKHFIDYLRKEHGIMHVKALGYIGDKDVPVYHSHVLHHDYFTIKEISWVGAPKSMAVTSFVEYDFDILIDMTKGEWIPLRYVLERSIARFKVGRDASSESYDMLVQAKKNSTLDQYIHQVNHYLRSINQHEERQRV